MQKISALIVSIIAVVSSWFGKPAIVPQPIQPTEKVQEAPEASVSASPKPATSSAKVVQQKYDCKGPDGKMVIMKTREECAAFNKAWNPNPSPIYNQECLKSAESRKVQCEFEQNQKKDKYIEDCKKEVVPKTGGDNLEKKNRCVDKFSSEIMSICETNLKNDLIKCEIPLF